MSINDWTYCQINFQILDDGRGFVESGLANRQMWIRFIAQSENKTIRESVKLPIHTSSGILLAPNKNNLGQVQVLEELINQLKSDGWDEVEEGSGEWWQVRLRKLEPFQQPEKPKLKIRDRLMMGGLALAIIVLGYIGYSQFNGVNRLRHYTNVVVEPAPENSVPAVGQMVLINLDSRELDPLQNSLPAELLAQDTLNAETVVWLDCETESNWGGAQTDCAVTVIDWPQQQIIDERLIEGEFTPHPEDTPENQFVENRNDQAILAYLINLPRK